RRNWSRASRSIRKARCDDEARVLTLLSLATLDHVAPAVARPAYDPRGVGIGIVHLGIGAFHRAHQAIYTDHALAQQRGAWGICGVSLRSPDVRDRMTPQDGLYTAVEKSPAGVQRRIIGSVREVLFLASERKRVAARLADRAQCNETALLEHKSKNNVHAHTNLVRPNPSNT